MSKPDCGRCPLRMYWEDRGRWDDVKSETLGSGKKSTRSSTAIVSFSPSSRDSLFSRQEHALVSKAVKEAGFKNISIVPIVACQFPNSKEKEFLIQLTKSNKKRKDPIPSPVTCCAPRFADDMSGVDNLIPLGPLAIKHVMAGNPSLMKVRGGPAIQESKKILPTVSPSFAVFNPQWLAVFLSDTKKAKRHFDGELNWKDPEVLFDPTIAQVESFLSSMGRYVTYDVETDGIDPLTCNLRCIGIGSTDKVMIVPVLSIDGETRYYEPEEEIQLQSILREFFLDIEKVKVGHNAGYYDRMVIEQYLGVTPTPLLDTILLHKIAESEAPHSLGYVGSMFTDVPAWKAEHTALKAKTDAELYAYCATDVSVNAYLPGPLGRMADRRKQLHLYETDSKLQGLCVGMHRLGVRIDEPRRKQHKELIYSDLCKYLDVLRQNVSPTFNPNSVNQVQELLFRKWQLTPYNFTSMGEPSTDAATLRMLIGSPSLDEEQRYLLDCLRRYRKAAKLNNTYIDKFAPDAGVVQDGRVHADYNVHGTVTGRLSSSNPNFQNIPYLLRDMFIPDDGMVFVGADYDQLELRFASALAGARLYLDSFVEGTIDPHNLTGQMMFGDSFWSSQGAPDKPTSKGKGQFKRLRDLAKTICFSSLYGANPKKVHEILMKAEDKEGNLLYVDYTLQEVRLLHRKWMRSSPEFKSWWNIALKEWRRNGYIEERINGRRRYFYKEDFNAIVNYGVQAGGFSVVTNGMLGVMDEIKFNFDKRIGILNQLHDAILIQVPASDAEWVKEFVTETLTQQVETLGITFSAEAHIGSNWSEV